MLTTVLPRSLLCSYVGFAGTRSVCAPRRVAFIGFNYNIIRALIIFSNFLLYELRYIKESNKVIFIIFIVSIQ